MRVIIRKLYPIFLKNHFVTKAIACFRGEARYAVSNYQPL